MLLTGNQIRRDVGFHLLLALVTLRATLWPKVQNNFIIFHHDFWAHDLRLYFRLGRSLFLAAPHPTQKTTN